MYELVRMSQNKAETTLGKGCARRTPYAFQHFRDRGLVEWKATYAGRAEIGRNARANSQPSGEQRRARGCAYARACMKICEPHAGIG